MTLVACEKSAPTPAPVVYPDNYVSLKADGKSYVFPQNKALDASGRNAGVGFQSIPDSTGTTILMAAMGPFGTDSMIMAIRKRVPKQMVGQYDLNFNAVFTAQGNPTNSFFGTVPRFFEALTITDPLVLATYQGTGQLDITRYDSTKKTISGRFLFSSKVGRAPRSTVSEGIFNEVPLVQ